MHNNIASEFLEGLMVAKESNKPDLAAGDRWVSVKEAAQVQRRSEISVRRDLTKGRLRRFKCGARTLLRLSDVLGQIKEV